MIKRSKTIFSIFFIFFIFIYEILQLFSYLKGNITAHVLISIAVPLVVIFIYVLTLFNKKYNSSIFSLANFLSFIPILTFSNILAAVISFYLKNYLKTNITVSSFYFIITFIEGMIFLAIYLLFYKKDINKQFKDFIKNLNTYLIYMIVFFIVVLILSNFFTSIADLIPATAQEAANQEGIQKVLGIDSSKWFLIMVLVLIGPIIEEFVYRYILIEQVIVKGFKLDLMSFKEMNKSKDYKKILRDNVIILIVALFSGFLFASAHAVAASSLVNYIRDLFIYGGFAVGVSLAYLYSRNIFVTISIHIINNSLSVAVVIIALKNGLL